MNAEIILILSNSLLSLSILLYFYFKEVRDKEDPQIFLKSSQDFFREINESKDELVLEIMDNKNALVEEVTSAYLKHLQALEKIYIPKKDKVSEFISKEELENLSAVKEPNQIEETEEETKEKEFSNVLSHIPIDGNTKIVIENNQDLPEEII